MRTLLLLRHAKAEPQGSPADDHARDLTDRGRADAAAVGRWLKVAALVPDAVISSTALRARATAELAAAAAGFTGEIVLRNDLYEASPEAYLEALRGWPDDEAAVLMVGHNPTLEELLSRFVGQDQHMQTAAVAHLRLPWRRWSEARLARTGALVELWRPPHD